MRAPFVVIETWEPAPEIRPAISSSRGCRVDSPMPQNTTVGGFRMPRSWSANSRTRSIARKVVLSGISSRGQKVQTALQTDVSSRSIVTRERSPNVRYSKNLVEHTTCRPEFAWA